MHAMQCDEFEMTSTRQYFNTQFTLIYYILYLFKKIIVATLAIINLAEDDMGVTVLQLYPAQENKTGPQVIETLTRRIVNLGAVQCGQFLVDCEVYQSTAQQQQPGAGGQNRNLYILHNSEYPASVFSILECANKTVTLTSDTLFDLLMLKLTNVYKKKTTIESKGPRFEIGDFIVKLGSVTVGGQFKGILVEVEYSPGVVLNSSWGVLKEFMQGFLGSCVGNNPPQQLVNKGADPFSAVDTIHQYLSHFNLFRKTAGQR